MKRFLLTLVVCCLAGAYAMAGYEWTDGNGVKWVFDLNGSNATITSAENYPEDLVIPDYVINNEKQYPVTIIGSWGGFQAKSNIKTLTTPESCYYISDGAFDCCYNLTSINCSGVTRVNYYAFRNCSSLKSISLPKCTSIGNYAFYGCSSLQTLDLPKCQSVSYNSFRECSALESISLPSCTWIGEAAFYNDTNLTTAYLPLHPSFGANAFYGCGGGLDKIGESGSYTNANNDTWGFIIYTDGVGITSYSGSASDIILPEKVTYLEKEYDVVAVADNVFKSNTSITSFTGTANLTSIGSDAFYGCSNLTSVDGLEKVLSIGSQAFRECKNLSTVGDMPSLKKIGYHAFYYCQSLALMGDVSNVESIDYEAFYSCSSLTSLNLSAVTSIEYYAFSGCSSLTTVGDISKVAKIGSQTFYSCEKLKSVDLASVTAIESNAFQYCYNLTSLGSMDNVMTISSYAFFDCRALNSLPDMPKLTSIGEYAFYNCNNLTTIGNMPELTNISNYVFWDCYNLATIGNTDKLTGVGNYAFNNCQKLKAINISKVINLGTGAFRYCYALKDVGVLEEMINIGSEAFIECSGLESITLGAKAKIIGENAFTGCTSLTSFDVDAGNTNYKSIDGVLFSKATNDLLLFPKGKGGEYTLPEFVTSIGDYAFQNCTKLTAVLGTDNVTSIGKYAFSGTTDLTTLGNLGKVTSVGERAFYDCQSLTSAEMPNLETIGAYAFYNCTQLSSIGETRKLKEIPEYAFRDCGNLETIGELLDVTSVGQYALYGCSRIQKIQLPKATSIGQYALYNGPTYLEFNNETPATLSAANAFSEMSLIQVPATAIATYKEAQYWSEFATRIVAIGVETKYEVNLAAKTSSSALNSAIGSSNMNNVVELKITGTMNSYDIMIIRNKMVNLHYLDLSEATVVANSYEYYQGYHSEDSILGYNAFSYLSKLLSVKLPRVKTVNGAFRGCENLHTVVLADCTERLSNAFDACSNLKNVSLNEGLKYIDGSTFRGCKSLQSIVLPQSLTNIGSYAFAYCWALRGIDIPANVEKIGSNAFYMSNYYSYYDDSGNWHSISGNTGGNFSYINFPKDSKLKSIDSYAFRYCQKLEIITLPTSLETIGYEAFRGCSKLDEVRIPSSVRTVDNYAFADCSNVKKVYTYIVEPTDINQNTFSCWQTATLYVPEQSWNNYYYDTQWSQFLNLAEFNEPYDYFYINGDYTLDDETGTIEGTPDVDMGNESGLITEGNETQQTGEITVENNGEGSGGSIIADDNLTADKLNIKIHVLPNKWYFFCFPYDVDLGKVLCDAKNYIFRYYDGEERAKNGSGGWKNLPDGTKVLNAGQGYIFQCDNSGTLTLPIENPEFKGEDKNTTLDVHASGNSQDASWNFIGNPFLSYFNMDVLEEMGITTPVTIWNGSNYEAVRPGDDDYQFYPFQAFFVQKSNALSEIIFGKDGRETKHQANENSKKAKADFMSMRFVKKSKNGRQLINLEIAGNEVTDKTRVVYNDAKSESYEMDCDAAKFLNDGAAIQIYSLDSKNVKYSINERPKGDVKLGIVAKVAGTYTLYATRLDTEVCVLDKLTGETHNMNEEGFTFSTEEGAFHDRFVLMMGEATGIEAIKESQNISGSDESSTALKYNLSGVRAGDSKKGVVIENGKKVIIR